MIQKLILFASILSLMVGAVRDASAQWVPSNGAGTDTCDIRVLVANGSNLFAASSRVGAPVVFRSIDNGTTWTPSADIHAKGPVFALAVLGTNLFASTVGGGVLLSTDNGINWNPVNDGLTDSIALGLVAVGANLFAGTQFHGVFLSTNNGTNWTSAGAGLDSVAAFAVIGTNLFAGTYGNGVFLSTNKGASWTSASTGLTSDTVNALGVIGTNLFAGTRGGGVFLSTDNGTSWVGVNSGLIFPIVDVFAISGTNLFAGTGDRGVFLSTDAGQSWSNVNTTGLTSIEVDALAVSGSNLFAGTYGSNGSGIWRRPLSDFGISAVSPVVSHSNSVMSYPNPFSQSTKINVSSPESGVSEISVANLLGQEVARIFSGELSAGDHSFTWEANGASAGTYICIVRINGHVARTSMILE